MGSLSKILTREEFASLLMVGNTSAVRDPPAVIPAEHRTRLIKLGYIADLAVPRTAIHTVSGVMPNGCPG
jgi:hypothetical protein